MGYLPYQLGQYHVGLQAEDTIFEPLFRLNLFLGKRFLELRKYDRSAFLDR